MTTSHYFYAHARSFRLDDAEVDEVFRTNYTQVFNEDKTVLDAQQASLNRGGGAQMIDINADAPCLQTRNLLRDMIAAEYGAASRAAAE